jgi:hypothetical protein
MNKFKVGDKVKVVNMNFDMKGITISLKELIEVRLECLNKEFTITKVRKHEYDFFIYELNNLIYTFQEQNIEIVEEKKDTFKVGDKVVRDRYHYDKVKK